MADSDALKAKVDALQKSTSDIIAFFDPDDEEGDHPGSGRAQITCGTWPSDDFMVVRAVKKTLRQLNGIPSEQLRRETINEALATYKASHMEGFPELIAWNLESATLILTDMGRLTLDTYFSEAIEYYDFIGHAEMVLYKVLCLITQLHSVGVFHLDLSWHNLVMDAGSVRDAISCGLQTRVSLIDLGACKISPRACLIDSDESDGQALDANECFNVEQYCARGARLEDLWAGILPDLNQMSIGNGRANARRQDLYALGCMAAVAIPLDDMAEDLTHLIRGITASKVNERFDPSAPLHDHAFSKRMRKRAVQEGWATFVTGSKDPTTDADVSMPMAISQSQVEAFKKVAESFKNPLDMMRAMMSSTVLKARQPPTEKDAPVAVGASSAGCGPTTESDKEEDPDVRVRFSDKKGKGKARVFAMPQAPSARGSNTVLPDRAASAAGAAGASSPPVAGATIEPPSETAMEMEAAARGATATVRRTQPPSRIQPRRTCKIAAFEQGDGVTEAAMETTWTAGKRGRAGREVGGVRVPPMAVSGSRMTKKARTGRQSSSRERKRRREDGEGARSSEGVIHGGGLRKRHRQAEGVVSGVASASSGVSATTRVGRAKPSARPPLGMTLRSMAVGTTETVATKEDIPKGDGSGGGSSRQDGCQGGGVGSHAAANSSSSRYR